jgi:soluble lytic murein transglycosylase-like protein
MPGTILLEDAQKFYTDRLQQHAQDALQAVQQANEPPLRNAAAPALPNPQVDPNAIVQRLQQFGQDAFQAAQQANQPPLQGAQIDPNAITARLQQHAQDAFQAVDQTVQPISQGLQQAVQPIAQAVDQGVQQANRPPLQNAVQPTTPTVDRGGDLRAYARQAALRAGIDPDIFERQIQQESGFSPTAKSPAGAQGIAQFMPDTAAGLKLDPSDPYASLDAAAQLDAQNLARYGGDYAKALAAYNAGGGNVDKYGGVPPFAETQDYVKTILGGAKQAAQNLVGGVRQAITGQRDTSGDVFPVVGYAGQVADHWGSVKGGSDIMAPRGTPVVAMRGGKVLESGWNDVGGNSVLIQGDDGNQYYYAHFDGAPTVKVGDNVPAGVPLGVVGNTGDAQGGPTHLHIGIGPNILLGADKYGGTGGDFDAVGLLRSTLQGGGQHSANTATGPASLAPPTPQAISAGAQQLVQQGSRAIQGGLQDAVSGATQAIGGVAGAVGGLASDVGSRARQAVENPEQLRDIANQVPLPLTGGSLADVAGPIGTARDLASQVQTPPETENVAARAAGTGLSALGTVARAVTDELDRLSVVSTAAREAAGEDVYGQKYAAAGGPQLEDEYRQLLAQRMSGDDSGNARMAEIAGRLQQINDTIRAGKPMTEVNQALSAENPLTPVSVGLANVGAAILAAPLIAGEAPAVARALAEILQPGTNPLELARAVRVIDASHVTAPQIADAIDQVRKMPGTAELAPVRAQVTQSSTDLLQAMLDAARAKGADPDKLAALEQQITQMDPTAATRRALSAPEAVQRGLAVPEGAAPDIRATQPQNEANTVRQLSTWLVNREGRPGISVEPMANGVGTPRPENGWNIVYRDADGQPQGILAVLKNPDQTLDVAEVAVNPEFQRQGVATSLYQAAKDAGIDVDSVAGRGGYTPQGAALAQARLGGVRGAVGDFLTGTGSEIGAANPRVAATLGGAVAGGAAGNATTPEDAGPVERGARIAGGAALGASAGAALGSAASYRGGIDQTILESLRNAGLHVGPPRPAAPYRGIIPEVVDQSKQLLLTSPTTHIGNVIGGTIELGRQPIAMAMGGRADDALAGLTSVGKAIPQAAGNAISALRGLEQPNLVQGASRIPLRQPIYRALSAADAFVRTLGEYQGMASEANRLLRDAGMSPGDPGAASYLATHAPDLFRAGARAGAQSVFGQAGTTATARTGLENVFRVYNNFKEGLLASPDKKSQAMGALLDFEIPFSGVPVRMLQLVASRTPPGTQIRGAVRAAQALARGDGPEAQRIAGETALESSIQFLIAKNIADGNIRGPDDPDHPNGVHMPGLGWINTTELGAYALPMQVMSAFADGYEKGGQNIPPSTPGASEGEKYLNYYTPRFNAALNASMKPFVQAVPGANMIRALSVMLQGDVTGAGVSLARDAVNRLTVPGAARFVENLTDPVARDVAKKGVASLWEGPMSAWPGLADRLPAKIDPTTGEELNKARSGIGTLVGQQQDVISPLSIEADRLKRAGFDVTAPKAYPDTVSIGGADIKLSPDEQRQVTQITGKQLAALAERLNQPDYQNSTDTRKAQLMQAYIGAAEKARVAALRDVVGVDELRNRAIAGQRTAGRLNVQATPPAFTAPPFVSSSSQSAQEQQAVGAGR